MAPCFSIVIATWNRASLLPRALASVENQSFRDLEVIVVDDGSSDETQAVVEPWRRNPAFRYLRREHAGISAAKNAGIAAAQGAWITFLDSDDAYAPDHLEVRHRFIASHPQYRFIHGGFRLIGPAETAFVPDANDPARLIPLSECAIGGTFVIESGFLRELGGFPDVPYAMDYELLKLATARGAAGLCDAPTYLYIREPGAGECEQMRWPGAKAGPPRKPLELPGSGEPPSTI